MCVAVRAPETVIPCDVVIFAIGQRPDLSALTGKVETVRNRTVAVDKDTLATNVPGIFAGGDAVTGTTFVVDAIAAGHRAARSIDAYLQAKAAWPPDVAQKSAAPVANLDEVQARALMAAKSQAP